MIATAFGLGFVSGVRTMTGLGALLVPRNDTLGRTIGAMAAGEYIGDKLPNIPPRTQPVPLLGRIGAGATVGTLVAKRAGKPWLGAAAAGAAGALAGAYAGYGVRRALGARIGNVPAAFIEDALVLTAATLLVRS